MPTTRSQERERRVNNRLDALEGAIEELGNRINNFMRFNEGITDSLNDDVRVISNKVLEHEADISHLKAASSQYETDIEGLKEELNSLKRTIETMSATESGHHHSS